MVGSVQFVSNCRDSLVSLFLSLLEQARTTSKSIVRIEEEHMGERLVLAGALGSQQPGKGKKG